jgi:2,3-bisphosphoglycerate-independent phosphoglycerate mutase
MKEHTVLLVLLDGLGDLPCPELAGRTPLEAANTPNLDRMAAEGASGVIYPLGPGMAPSSELAHFAYFGYSRYPFPGRAVLEGLGRGLTLPPNAVVTFAGLVSTVERHGCLYLQGPYRSAEDEEARRLLASVREYRAAGLALRLQILDGGDALLGIDGPASEEITDTDPFSTDHPVLQAQPYGRATDPEAAAITARVLNAYLGWVHQRLKQHPVNQERQARGLLPLDMLVTRWTGRTRPLPSFRQYTGMRGAIVASSRLYRGFAVLLGLEFRHVPPSSDPAAEMRQKLAQALTLVRQGFQFVHLHTKAADEAGHSHRPDYKKEVIERLDQGLTGLWQDPSLLERMVVAVTSDHCTPSWGPLLHSGDAVPLAVRGTTVRVDHLSRFGERAAVAGALGQLRGEDLMPLLLNLAGRAAFQGARHTPYPPLGRVSDVRALRVGSAELSETHAGNDCRTTRPG